LSTSGSTNGTLGSSTLSTL